MGTNVKPENWIQGNYLMQSYGASSSSNGHFYNSFPPRPVPDYHPGNDKDAVKQTMLVQDAIFKDQVGELHRLHRVQRDLMDEAKGKSIQGGPSAFQNRYHPIPSGVSMSRPSELQADETEFQVDVGKSKGKGLADLNEPLHDESTAFSSVSFLRHLGNHNDVPYYNIPHNTQNGSLRGAVSELNKANVRSMNQARPPPSYLTSQLINGEQWRFNSLGITERFNDSYSTSSYPTPEPFPRFHGSSHPGLFRPVYLGHNESATKSYTMPNKGNNLNVGFPNGLSDNYINSQRLKTVNKDSKPEDPSTVLPLWLRGKGDCSSGSGSSSDSSVKLFGVSIFGNPPMPKNSSDTKENEESKCGKRKYSFDINIPCEASDSDLDNKPVEKETKFESLRSRFDLNSCVSDEDMPCLPVKVASTGVDLEALFDLENAASAIVAMSSNVNSEKTCLPIEAEEDDPLNWFANLACSTGNDSDTQVAENDGLPDGVDYFEHMTLELKECTPEEYFPKPFIPELPNIENDKPMSTSGTTRTGKSRRGRQRKQDFQTDILLSLKTLSRYEISEDLQIFGALMREKGLEWQSGTNRARNGRGRGRPRSAGATTTGTVCTLPLKDVPVKTAETSVDDRSLGWGKNTKRPRPRRKRCSEGNPAQ